MADVSFGLISATWNSAQGCEGCPGKEEGFRAQVILHPSSLSGCYPAPSLPGAPLKNPNLEGGDLSLVSRP